MTKFILLAIITWTLPTNLYSQILKPNQDSVRVYIARGDSFIDHNKTAIVNFIERHLITSKLTCFEKYTPKHYNDKLKVLYNIKTPKKNNLTIRYNKLKKDYTYRINSLMNTDLKEMHCYDICGLARIRNFYVLDTVLSDYLFLKIRRDYFFKEKCSVLQDSSKNILDIPASRCWGNYCQHEFSRVYLDNYFLVAVSKNPNKTNLILGEEFCYSDTNWKFIFHELCNTPNVAKSSKENIIKLFLDLYMEEYLDNWSPGPPRRITLIKQRKDIYEFEVKNIGNKLIPSDKYETAEIKIKVKINGSTGEILSIKSIDT